MSGINQIGLAVAADFVIQTLVLAGIGVFAHELHQIAVLLGSRKPDADLVREIVFTLRERKIVALYAVAVLFKIMHRQLAQGEGIVLHIVERTEIDRKISGLGGGIVCGNRHFGFGRIGDLLFGIINVIIHVGKDF